MAKNHLKRLAMPKTWPLARKKNTFITRVRPGSNKKDLSLPLTTVLTEVLGLARTAREVRYLLRKNKVTVAGKRRNDYRSTMGLMEVLSFPDQKQHFRLVMDSLGKLVPVSIDDKEATVFPHRIEGVTSLKGGKAQYNLFGGRNLVLDKHNKDYKIGDTLVLDDKNKVTAHISLKKGAQVFFTAGRFQGQVATVDDIQGHTIIITTKDATAMTLKEFAYVLGDKKPVITLAQ